MEDHTIFERASVRAYTDEPITDAQIEDLMRAAMAAPSAGNQQPWEFYVVQNHDLLAQLATVSPYAGPVGKAPLGIVACVRKDTLKHLGFESQDMGACVENLLLEATNLELGAVWLGIAPIQERMDAVARVLDIPAALEPFAIIAVGHPAGQTRITGPKRFDPERIHVVA